jgi:hypothetical protein
VQWLRLLLPPVLWQWSGPQVGVRKNRPFGGGLRQDFASVYSPAEGAPKKDTILEQQLKENHNFFCNAALLLVHWNLLVVRNVNVGNLAEKQGDFVAVIVNLDIPDLGVFGWKSEEWPRQSLRHRSGLRKTLSQQRKQNIRDHLDQMIGREFAPSSNISLAAFARIEKWLLTVLVGSLKCRTLR